MHLTGGVLDFGVWMRCGVVEEMVDVEGDVVPGAGGDGGCDGDDCGLHGVVDGSCIVVENSGEFLTVFGLCRSELMGGNWFCELLFLAVDWCGIGMR